MIIRLGQSADVPTDALKFLRWMRCEPPISSSDRTGPRTGMSSFSHWSRACVSPSGRSAGSTRRAAHAAYATARQLVVPVAHPKDVLAEIAARENASARRQDPPAGRPVSSIVRNRHCTIARAGISLERLGNVSADVGSRTSSASRKTTTSPRLACRAAQPAAA